VAATSLKESIHQQREALSALLGELMHELAARCAGMIHEPAAVEALLTDALPHMRHCKHLYVMDPNGIQLTDNITRDGHDPAHYGRDRSDRPYMREIVGTSDFRLSEAYISRNAKRPSLTAIQVIRNADGERIGFLGADYDLRELPQTAALYREPSEWRQVKGDPAIRSSVFQQQRVESAIDTRLDEVFALLSELMSEHGVFHSKLHFSSNRATIWLVDDPYSYRLLGFEELTDPDTCLAYPRREYFERAIIAPGLIMPIFEGFRRLRFADENVYLRAGSINVVNGMVALNFSCDGSHYLRFDEFLSKDSDFWFGATGESSGW